MAKTLAQGRKPGSGRKPGKGKTLREGRKPGSGRRRRQVTSTATGLLKDNAVITSGSTVFTNQQQISLRDIEAADALTELTNSSPQCSSSNANTTTTTSSSSTSTVTTGTTTNTNTSIPNTATTIHGGSVSGVSSPPHGDLLTNTDDNNSDNDIGKDTTSVSREPKPSVIEVVPPRPFLTYNRVLSASPQDTNVIQRDSTPLLPQVSSSPVYQNGSNGGDQLIK